MSPSMSENDGAYSKFWQLAHHYTRICSREKAGVLDKMFEELQRPQVVRIRIEAAS